MNNLNKLCNNIVEHLAEANFANVLSISKNINTTNDQNDLPDIDLFFNTLSESILSHFGQGHDLRLSRLLLLINEYQTSQKDSLNKSYLIDNFLTRAWEIMHEDA